MSLLDLSGCKGGYARRSPELDRSLGKEGISPAPMDGCRWLERCSPYLEHSWDFMPLFLLEGGLFWGAPSI